MHNGRKLMRIGDLARRAGTTLRTIRYYEERGLIRPAGRTKGGFRLYEEEELRKLTLIRNLQILDMPLAHVKAFFDRRERGRPACEVTPPIQQALRAQLQAVEDRLAQYQALRDSVVETIQILESCSTCPRELGPDVCPPCPVLASRAHIPIHMQAIIEAARPGAAAPAGADR